MNCIFCKIVKREIDSVKIWEDEKFLAILDINPNMKGMTSVLTKDHYDSYAFDMPDDIYLELMTAAKKVAKMLERGLGVKRVSVVMEGMGINHATLNSIRCTESRKNSKKCGLKRRYILNNMKVIFQRS